MSQKKCPKCGENNPVEAVMCWACYTPLAGGATASATATAPASAIQGDLEGTTKKAIAPWQIGAVVAVLIVLGLGVSKLTGGSAEVGTPTTTGPIRPPDIYAGGGVRATTTYNSGSSAPAAATVPAQPTQPGEMLFTVALPPKDGVSWGTMAIVPQGTASAQNPASLAAAACQQAVGGGKWDGLYVYVFTDADSAQKFRQYQRERGGQPLRSADYSELQQLWSQVPVRYEYSHGKEAIRYPSKNPGGWWDGTSSFRPAKI